MAENKTKQCRHCKLEIDAKAKVCPHCGKKQKRGILSKILIAAVVLLMLAAAFGKGDDTSDSKKAVTDAANTAGEGQSSAEASRLPTIQETVLIDEKQVKVTALEYVEDSLWGQGIKVKVENNSKENIAVTLDSMSANNYMVTDDLFYCDAAAGKSASDTIWLSDSFRRTTGIETVADIIMNFHVSSSDSYDTLFTVKDVELKTSASGTVEQPALDEGKELYNKDGIRILAQYVDEDTFLGTAVQVFMENASKRDVIIQCENMSINDMMVEGYFSTQINSGKMAIDTIDVLSSDLEENNITQVQNVELNLLILDPDSFETLAESGVVSFSVK
ncbi:MAG: hypothetical protein SOW08_09355 [Lachnospiraceae bacterium]|nr:hypothetical protein [Lachnospiraceae bacterium]